MVANIEPNTIGSDGVSSCLQRCPEPVQEQNRVVVWSLGFRPEGPVHPAQAVRPNGTSWRWKWLWGQVLGSNRRVRLHHRMSV